MHMFLQVRVLKTNNIKQQVMFIIPSQQLSHIFRCFEIKMPETCTLLMGRS
jgi:hypothetical protein